MASIRKLVALNLDAGHRGDRGGHHAGKYLLV